MSEQAGLDTSLLGFYVSELVKRRVEAGLSQSGLAALIPTAPAVINRVESGKQNPTYALSVAIDRALHSGKFFQRLWVHVAKEGAPSWYRPVVEIEGRAARIQTYEPQLIPGLFQTEEYARAVLARGIAPDRIEASLVARMDRQRVLTRERPPDIWAVIDESTIRRPVGNARVIAQQLRHLADVAVSMVDYVTLQIVPLESAAYLGIVPFSLFHLLNPSRDYLHEDGVLQGRLTSEPDSVASAQRFYDLLRAAALPPEASMRLIEAAVKEVGA